MNFFELFFNTCDEGFIKQLHQSVYHTQSFGLLGPDPKICVAIANTLICPFKIFADITSVDIHKTPNK